MEEKIKKEILEFITTFGFSQEHSNKISDLLTTHIFDESYFQILTPEQKELFEKAIVEKDGATIQRIHGEIDSKQFQTLIESSTKKVILNFLNTLVSKASEDQREELLTKVQKFGNKSILKDIKTGSAEEILEQLGS